MSGEKGNFGPTHEQLTFRTIYRHLGRRVYLLLLFVLGVLLLILILLWRQQAFVVHNSERISDTGMQLANYSSTILQLSGETTNQDPVLSPTFAEEPFNAAQALTVNNHALYLDGLYVAPADQPAAGDVSGSFNNGFVLTADSVALGPDTTGNYVQGIVTGNGLSGGVNGEGSVPTLAVQAGEGISVGTDGVSVALQTGGGFLFAGGGLSLLDTCSDAQVLKWEASSDSWLCAADNAGSGALTVELADDSLSVSPASLLEFGPVSSSSEEFLVSDEGAGAARIRLGTTVPRTNSPATISSAWAFNGGLSCSDCISLGAETSGNYLAGLLVGNGLNITGSGSEGATPTVSLDSSLAIFKTIDTALGTDPVADSLTDTLSLQTGNGLTITGDATTDSVTFNLNVSNGGGLAFDGAALSLINSCDNGEYLAWDDLGSAWECTPLAGAPNVFTTIAGDSGTATTDAASDNVTLVGGNGLTSTGSDVGDTVTFNIDLAGGSGLAFNGGALTLQSCSDGEILKRSGGSWTCGSDNDTAPSGAYRQHLSGADNITLSGTLTPLLTNGSATPLSLSITILAGHEVSLVATIETNTTLATGSSTFVLIRDDNQDNDCVIGSGDGTQIGGQISNFIASTVLNSAVSISFTDTSPIATTSRYQLCGSTTIGLGTTTVTDRSLTLHEIEL
jgi:hypothetical protein